MPPLPPPLQLLLEAGSFCFFRTVSEQQIHFTQTHSIYSPKASCPLPLETAPHTFTHLQAKYKDLDSVEKIRFRSAPDSLTKQEFSSPKSSATGNEWETKPKFLEAEMKQRKQNRNLITITMGGHWVGQRRGNSSVNSGAGASPPARTSVFILNSVSSSKNIWKRTMWISMIQSTVFLKTQNFGLIL